MGEVGRVVGQGSCEAGPAAVLGPHPCLPGEDRGQGLGESTHSIHWSLLKRAALGDSWSKSTDWLRGHQEGSGAGGSPAKGEGTRAQGRHRRGPTPEGQLGPCVHHGDCGMGAGQN